MLYTVLPDCDSGKTKLGNTEMAQTLFIYIFEHINHFFTPKAPQEAYQGGSQ